MACFHLHPVLEYVYNSYIIILTNQSILLKAWSIFMSFLVTQMR